MQVEMAESMTVLNSDSDILGSALTMIRQRLEKAEAVIGRKTGLLAPGKILRTQLAARLTAAGVCGASLETITDACVAVELAHVASLCHDDTIDEGSVRRHRPALWTVVGRSAAILTGDLLLCEAMELMIQSDNGLNLASFLSKVRQMVEGEIRHEFHGRGQSLNEAECLRMARDKTGPLFAFAAEVCGGADMSRRQALTEAGYLIGAAYQLADDLIDIIGLEDKAGKTLGTDAARGKFTMPQAGLNGPAQTTKLIGDMLSAAIEEVRADIAACQGLQAFIRQDLVPVFASQGLNIKGYIL
jgi:geranylgeranyl diphosphate synthase type I